VKKAASADLGYFLVELGGTRSEYYVVGVDKKGSRVVGMKAVAVQS
jgi:phage gp45-like